MLHTQQTEQLYCLYLSTDSKIELIQRQLLFLAIRQIIYLCPFTNEIMTTTYKQDTLGLKNLGYRG